MHNIRVWIFRVLIIAATCFMLLSWFMPWWRCFIWGINREVLIRPWGLEHDLGDLTSYIAGAEMPAFFALFMWIYLGLCVAVLLFSLFANEKTVSLGKFKLSLTKLLIGIVGVSYIVVVVSAVIVAAIRTGDFFGVHLIGTTVIDLGEPMISDADAGLLIGYWLACSVGPLLVVLALLRDKIIGK